MLRAEMKFDDTGKYNTNGGHVVMYEYRGPSLYYKWEVSHEVIIFIIELGQKTRLMVVLFCCRTRNNRSNIFLSFFCVRFA